jgi:methionyl-tRNA formyltransferase
MLPEVVWNMPRFGTFNLHASLLPQYRGAAPINWAIINGEKETGATTFFLTHEIDTGKIILQEKVSIANEDDAGVIHDKLMVMGAQMVKRTVDLIVEGKADAIDQSVFVTGDVVLKSAPKLFKDNCRIDFTKSVEEVYNLVRGLSPYPAAWTEIKLPDQSEPMVCKIFKTQREYANHNFEPGSVHTDGKKFLKIALKDGFIDLREIQAPGKKRMDAGAFLRGLR